MNISTEDTRFLELLRKWRSGDFTRADEQEMKALAVEDPFRQEALQGFLEFPDYDHAAALDALRDRIRGEQRDKRILLPQILAIAAALVLIFGAIWFFNIRPIPQDQEQMAQELPKSTETNTESETSRTSSPQPPSPSRVKTEEPSGGSQGPSMVATDDRNKEKRAASPMAADKQEDLANAKDNDVALGEAKARQSYQQPGIVTEQSTNAPRPEERAKAAAGMAMKKSASKPSPDKIQQKADTTTTAASSTSPENQPQDGWDAFRAYLSNKARLTPAALANNVTGTVRLKFSLDQKSQPVDFKILTKLGYGCDEVAIQLVKSISWTRVDNQAIIVDVPFIR